MEVDQIDPIESFTPESFIESADSLKKLLADEHFKSKIPLISNSNRFDQLQDMQLVRFRGLVQNMLDPEIYLETYQVQNGDAVETRNGKFRDNIKLKPNEEVIYDSELNKHGERRPMFLVSIPGLNDWATRIELENNQHKLNSQKTSLAIKRPPENPMSIDAIPIKRSNNDSGSESIEQSITQENKPNLLNSPIADRPGNSCLIKFYDDVSTVALNSVFDVIGFVSLDASLCGSNRHIEEFENADEVKSMNPPPSLIPRIHVISYQSIDHLNPLMYSKNDKSLDHPRLECLRSLRTAFTQCLFGDEIAADYLLCHLTSTVYVRSEETLGQFALNLTSFPNIDLKLYTQQLYDMIESCLPASHYSPITVDFLNKTDFIPMTIQREAKGIEAVHHLANLIRKQQISVDFKFYQINYDANIPVLIFSEGKSMFPSNCHIPLKPDLDTIQHIQETFAAVKQFLKPKLNAIRCFLTEMRLQEFNMNPNNMQMIQDYFVEMRRMHNVSANDLHSMLVLSRLLGILEDKTGLDEESWNRAKSMEEERRTRISQLPTNRK